MLFSPLPQPCERLECRWEQLTAVAIGPSLSDRRLHRVRSDYGNIATMAMEQCHRLGYRRPGIALPEEVNCRTEYRCLAACLAKQRDFGLVDPPAPLSAGEWSREVFLRWVREERPDVVLVTKSGSRGSAACSPCSWESSPTSAAAVAAALATGLTVPHVRPCAGRSAAPSPDRRATSRRSPGRRPGS